MGIHRDSFPFLPNQLFEEFKKVNVLIVGDVMIDRYLTGKIERISPEAPVPVVRLLRDENRLGGAANVALNIKALGANPILCSVIGKDEMGEGLFNRLQRQGITPKYLLQTTKRQTTVKTRIIASNQHVLRVDREDTNDLEESNKLEYLELVREILDQKEIHVILFQDYNKGVLSTEVIREITLEAIKQDIPTVVDPKKKNFWEYKRATLFKPNFREIAAQVPFEVDSSMSALKRAAAFIQSKLGNQYSMITLSEKGIFSHGKESNIFPTTPRPIVDVCGAGDAVISVAAIGMALKLNMPTIAVLSNIAGGQVCGKVGVAPVQAQELQVEYETFISKFERKEAFH